MLSFDITDRNIRVVKGVESSGKIKISSAATISVDEGLIVEQGEAKAFFKNPAKERTKDFLKRFTSISL